MQARIAIDDRDRPRYLGEYVKGKAIEHLTGKFVKKPIWSSEAH